jgi:glycosyltransferase involved in cell wall biosynthesis
VKVLISAFTAHPRGSSEQGVGWNWSAQAARSHDVWVLTNRFHEADIRRELEEHPNPHLHFVFHSVPKEPTIWSAARKFHPVYYPAYLLWQATALDHARKLHEEIGFDVTQHLTWASHRFPSLLAWLDAPFIWGPIGGGESAPANLYRSLGARLALGELTRDTSNWLVRVDPTVRHTANRATRILTTSQETAAMLPGEAAQKAEIYPAIGLRLGDLDKEIERTTPAEHTKEARLLFVGRLVAWKGCQFALEALAKLAAAGRKATLTVVGMGPELKHLQARASELGIAEQVDFRGNLPHEQVLQLCLSHDVFVFPSLHDSGGQAVLEAMYLGLPVICLDLGGPALSVGDTGIRVACHSVEQVVEDLADGIETILGNPALRSEMIGGARDRVIQMYDWDHKAEFIGQLYERTTTC